MSYCQNYGGILVTGNDFRMDIHSVRRFVALNGMDALTVLCG